MRVVLAAIVGVLVSLLVFIVLLYGSLFVTCDVLDQESYTPSPTLGPIATLLGGLLAGLLCKQSTCSKWWQSLLISPGLYYGILCLLIRIAAYDYDPLTTSALFIAWSWAGVYTGLGIRAEISPSEFRPQTAHLPGRLKRLGAYVTDMAIAVISVVVLSASGALNAMQELVGSDRLGGIYSGFILWAILYGYTLQTRRQTPGKFIFRIYIANSDGTVPPLWRVIVLRYWLFASFYTVPVFGGLIYLLDALFIFRKDRRCLHDLVARTVIRDSTDHRHPQSCDTAEGEYDQ